MPSGFAVCFKRGLVDHTIDPDSLLHEDVLCFDHHAAGQKTILVSHLYIACHIHELVW